MIKIIIPIKAGYGIPQIVLDGIASQLTETELVVSEMEPIPDVDRELSINANRHRLQGMIIDSVYVDKYIVLMDSDVVMTDPTAISSMCKYLDDNEWCGCVAIDTKGYTDPTHVVCACAVIRYDVYSNIDFLTTSQCQCCLVASYCKSQYLYEVSAYELERTVKK